MADQTDRQRAIQAVRDILVDYFGEPDGPHGSPAYDHAAAELVDAVQGAGREGQDEAQLIRTLARALPPRVWPDLPELYTAEDVANASHDGYEAGRTEGEARGYQQAVDNLRDDQRYQTWWVANRESERCWKQSPIKNAADYLEAVGPGGTAAEVVHRCPVWNSAITPCCRRTPFELSRHDRLTTNPAQVTCGRAEHHVERLDDGTVERHCFERKYLNDMVEGLRQVLTDHLPEPGRATTEALATLEAAQAGQDGPEGAEVDAGSAEVGTGGSGTEGRYVVARQSDIDHAIAAGADRVPIIAATQPAPRCGTCNAIVTRRYVREIDMSSFARGDHRIGVLTNEPCEHPAEAQP